MSETSNGSPPYRVSYSELVRNELEKLIARAEERDLGSQVRAAVRKLDHLFHIYPQFGQPSHDLAHKGAQLWIGVVAPLVVRYAIYQEERLVIVTIPIATLPHAGF